MEQLVDLNKQREWSGKHGEIVVPEAYLKGLRYEIVVFVKKERGGSDFSFQCREYYQVRPGEYKFKGIVMDTSIKNAEGEVELVRLSYHPELLLVNVGFMIFPAPADADSSRHS